MTKKAKLWISIVVSFAVICAVTIPLLVVFLKGGDTKSNEIKNAKNLAKSESANWDVTKETTATEFSWIEVDDGIQLKRYKGDAADVVIPNAILVNGKAKPVVALGVGAFRDRIDMKSVVIPPNVSRLEAYTFFGCIRLTNIDYKTSKLQTIPEHCFDGCALLKSITIPEGVTTIKEYAFYACQQLTDIVLPDSAQSYGGYCFAQCQALVHLELPYGVTKLPDYCFAWCGSLNELVLPTTIVEYGSCCFGDSIHNNYINFPIEKAGTGYILIKTDPNKTQIDKTADIVGFYNILVENGFVIATVQDQYGSHEAEVATYVKERLTIYTETEALYDLAVISVSDPTFFYNFTYFPG